MSILRRLRGSSARDNSKFAKISAATLGNLAGDHAEVQDVSREIFSRVSQNSFVEVEEDNDSIDGEECGVGDGYRLRLQEHRRGVCPSDLMVMRRLGA